MQLHTHAPVMPLTSELAHYIAMILGKYTTPYEYLSKETKKDQCTSEHEHRES